MRILYTFAFYFAKNVNRVKIDPCCADVCAFLSMLMRVNVVPYLSEGVWKWADGTLAPLPTATWHDWYDGEPDDNLGEDCAIITNYMFWDIYFRRTIDHYVWLDYRCTSVNAANEIQGYICEGKLNQ